MTTFNTGNAVPSADARDRFDNSQTFDEVINGGLTYYTNRIGNNVLSFKGMADMFNAAQFERDSLFAAAQEDRGLLFAAAQELRANAFEQAQSDMTDAFGASQSLRGDAFAALIAGSGWQSVGAYASGILITSHSQTVEYGGQPYALKATVPASIEAPYVTTGNWATENVNFKLVGDNSLRQDLADPVTADLGAAILGRGVVAVGALTNLLAIPLESNREDLRYLTAEYALGTGLGGGEWKWDSSDCSALVAIDPLNALYAAPFSDLSGASGAFRRVFSGAIDASWFGVVYGNTADASQGLNAATAFIKTGYNLIASGNILLKSQWNLFGLPKSAAARVIVRGIIHADVGDFTPVAISGRGYHFETAGMTRLGATRTGRPMEIRSTQNAKIYLGLVDRFADGPIAIGTYGHFGLNGIGWLQIYCQDMNVAGQVFTGTTEGGGWFNQNYIHFYAQYGANGIILKKGGGQTARFDGNHIISPGYEQISGICQRIEFGTRNITTNWRVENDTGTLAFSEDESCSRNKYYGAWAVVDTKLDLRGTLSEFNAQIINTNGRTLSFSAQQSTDGTMSYQSGAAWSSNAYPNSIELRVQSPNIQGYPSRLNIKNPDGSLGYIEVVPQETQQTVVAGTPSATVLPGIKLIYVSLGLANSPLELIMPVGLERNARELRLNVANFVASSPLSIKKSTGGDPTAGPGVSSAGLYSLGYVNGSWRVSKIGEAYSA